MRERRFLLDRPWREDLLHWGKDGQLHGTVRPPADGRRHSTTSDGWCPAWAVQVQNQYLSSSFLEEHVHAEDAETADVERDD